MVKVMWVKIIIRELSERRGSATCLGGGHREKKTAFFFFLACLCLSGERRISIKPCSWATESEEVDQTASCNYISSRVGLPQRRESERESKRNLHKHSVSKSEGGREGGMERDTTGSLLSLKGKAWKKSNSCTDSVTMDPCCSWLVFCFLVFVWETNVKISSLLILLWWFARSDQKKAWKGAEQR